MTFPGLNPGLTFTLTTNPRGSFRVPTLISSKLSRAPVSRSTTPTPSLHADVATLSKQKRALTHMERQRASLAGAAVVVATRISSFTQHQNSTNRAKASSTLCAPLRHSYFRLVVVATMTDRVLSASRVKKELPALQRNR